MKNSIILIIYTSLIVFSCNSNRGKDKTIDFNKDYDFSDLLMTDKNHGLDGVFDTSCYRIQLHFETIKKDLNNPGEYIIAGSDRLKKNVTPFTGKLIITKITEYPGNFYFQDKPDSLNHYVDFDANYNFEESKEYPGSGIFKGQLSFQAHRNNKNEFINDLADYMVDGYSNFIYNGKWKSYKTGLERVCIWGDGRFTDFNNFDQGDGVLMVNKKYIKNGWLTDSTGRYIDNPKKWWNNK